jgi:hypothetical protein
VIIYLCLFVCCARWVLLADGVNEPENEDVGDEYREFDAEEPDASRSLPRTPTEASPAYFPLMHIDPIFKHNP